MLNLEKLAIPLSNSEESLAILAFRKKEGRPKLIQRITADSLFKIENVMGRVRLKCEPEDKKKSFNVNSDLKKAFYFLTDERYHLDHRSDRIFGSLTDNMEVDDYYRMARILLKRFHAHTGDKLKNYLYLPALRITALSIAIKIMNEELIYNSDIIEEAELPFTAQVLSDRENQFLRKIDFETFVNPQELLNYPLRKGNARGIEEKSICV